MNTTIPTEQTCQPYAIYHATNIMAMLDPNPQDWLTNPEQHYQHVANIHAELGGVFFLTNHTDGRNWIERPEVFWVKPLDCPRSTSVGDVIYCPSTHQAWLISHSGLEE